jgi:pimeloyl-ACP methyl ester carboxylesterase
VLLSHGWGGRGAQLRTFVRPLLDAGYQVAFFDHVGHGFSGGVVSTLVHFVEGLDAVARHLERDGARIAGVVGHSLGAAAIAAWLNGTGRAARAVLIAPPTSLERYSGHFARRLGIREPVRRAMQERFERALGREWKEFELPQSVAGVRAAALVVHDLDDREVSPRAGVALARAWRGARFLATRGLGHRGVLRDPEVARDVVDFIADRVVFPPPPQPGDGASYGAPAPIL